MLKTLAEIERDFNSIDNLPTLPIIVLDILNLMHQNASMQKIGDKMELDPPITTKVLKIANSAYYGMRQRVDTMRRALVILGLNEISNIVMGISVVRSFKSKNGRVFGLEKFWEHSIAVAHFSKLLATEMNINTHGEEYTAGLIHDIGKLIFYQYYPEEYEVITELITEQKVPDYLAEKAVIGCDHMYIGYLLAKKWNLPHNLSQSILYHHNPVNAESNKELIAIVNIANFLANSMRISQFNIISSEQKTSQALNILRPYTSAFSIDQFKSSLAPEVGKIRQLLLQLIQEDHI